MLTHKAWLQKHFLSIKKTILFSFVYFCFPEDLTSFRRLRGKMLPPRFSIHSKAKVGLH